jgi:ribosomal protein S18 acetylase RimI-like enzyme
MSHVDIVLADAGDLTDLGAVAERAQKDPERFVCYYAEESAAIGSEIADIEGWPAFTHIARRSGRVIGWLAAETDDELHRVWWWGPVVEPGEPWAAVADMLYAAGRRGLDDRFDQEELAADARSTLFARFAEQHGFRSEEASSIFRVEITDTVADQRVDEFSPSDTDRVVTLHDALFANTHTTGRQLVDAVRGTRLVFRDDRRVIGYVAYEVQADGEGYIDYLGVDPDDRGSGVGEALVTTTLDALRREGTTVANLTVRIDSAAAARRLYLRLGFEELRIVRPFRKGFSIV